MTKQQAEQLYSLVNSEIWKVFIAYKSSKLDELHKELEWQAPENIKHVQGKIMEIREDLNLSKKVNDFFLQNN